MSMIRTMDEAKRNYIHQVWMYKNWSVEMEKTYGKNFQQKFSQLRSSHRVELTKWTASFEAMNALLDLNPIEVGEIWVAAQTEPLTS